MVGWLTPQKPPSRGAWHSSGFAVSFQSIISNVFCSIMQNNNRFVGSEKLSKVTCNAAAMLGAGTAMWTSWRWAPAGCVSGSGISSMGIPAPPPVENTPAPASQPPPRLHQERGRVNTLPEFNSVSALYFFAVSHRMPALGSCYEANWNSLTEYYQVVTHEYQQQTPPAQPSRISPRCL